MIRNIPLLNTANMSDRLRAMTWRQDSREILVARFDGSEQERDLSEPPNCGGVGRLRHFHNRASSGWPVNPLPTAPAERFLGRSLGGVTIAQVFQNLACNWRCWYCYVPFNLLAGDSSRGEFLTAAELVRRHLDQPDPPSIIDISGGQPDLIPEWTLDTLQAVVEAGEHQRTFVWSDDNLSTDYLWRYLTSEQIAWIVEQPNHGRVGCFKGFDEESFSYNTRAEPKLFQQQFELFDRLRKDRFDVYGYITLTTPNHENIDSGIVDVINRLQLLHPNVPLRVVPLEIGVFDTVESRLKDSTRKKSADDALANQQLAIAVWKQELEKRFSSLERSVHIRDVDITGC